MTLEHLVAFNIALAAAIVSPGPAFLIAVKISLSQGRLAGILLGFGLGLMAAIWTAMALLGLEIIFQIAPWTYVVLKFCGAIYLLYLALKLWKEAAEELKPGKKAAGNAFWKGIFVNAMNPKSMLFAASVLIVIFPKHMSLAENITIVLNQFVFEVCFYSFLAFAMCTPAVKNRYIAARTALDRISSIVLGALGLRLLINR